DLHGFEDTVPGHVDDADVHRIVLEVVLELAAAEEGFAACERRRDRAADQGKRTRIEAVDLDPHQPGSLDRAHEANVALGLEVEIEIEQALDVLAGAVAECCELLVKGCFDGERRIELRSAK